MAKTVQIIAARPHRLLPTLIRRLGEELKRGGRVLMLVPEQFTLQAEREIMERLGLEGFFDVEAVSPSRLSERVLERGGRDEREPLSAAGRRMAVSLALEKLEDKLGYYGSLSLRLGFVEKTAALITDLKRGGMTPERLTEYADALPSGIVKEKLRDVSLIYQQYESVLRGRFSDGEDQLAYAAGRLKSSGYVTDKHIIVYGFDALPDQLMRLLSAAAPLSASLSVGLLWDGVNAPDGELFQPVRQGVERFRRMLAEEGISLGLEPLPPADLDAPPPIRWLDRWLFARQPKPYANKQDCVYLFDGVSPYEEATSVSRQILRLLQNGVSIEKIAVLYPDQNGYAFAVTAALQDSGIPFYTDQKLPAVSHPLVRYLLCAIRAAADGYQNRDVLGMIKSGYSSLSFEEGCLLENYAFTYGVNRLRWTRPFTRGDAPLRERCEGLRQRLMEPVLTARAGIVAARTAAESMAAVFHLLTQAEAYQKLVEEEKRLLDHGLLARAGQNSQVWRTVLDLLDQSVRLSEPSRVPLKHLATRLESGFSAVSLATLPPAGNMLHVGLLGHSLMEDMDAVFLLGLNDGVLYRETQSLLMPEERSKIQEATDCFLGLTDESRGLFAKLDLLRAATLPGKWLFLSYAKTSCEGAALRPLTVLNTLQSRILPNPPQSPAAVSELPLSAAQALAGLGTELRAYVDGQAAGSLPPGQREILRKLAQSPATAPAVMRLLRSLHYDGSAQPIPPESARALFGDETLSVSRLEQFAQCAFRHFVTYGLRPHVLKEWKIDPIETGSFYHAALNNFAQNARKNPDYPRVTPEQLDEMTDQAIQPLTEDVMNGPMGDGDRNQTRFALARDAVRRAAEVITRQLAAGSFRLDRTEAAFGYETGLPPIVLRLSDGREVMLRGRIDRIDRYDCEDSAYLRVIDYKSSAQALEAARTWWGLQLQLLLYLDVCTSATPGGKPAGAFYFYVADPLVESETDAKEAVEEVLRKTFCLKGVSLCDVEILEAMDRGEEPCVIPPAYQKNGELRKDARALSMSQLTALMAHARETAAQLAQDMLNGRTEISPVQEGGGVSCAYCDYQSICHLDPSAPGAKIRELPSMTMEELRQRLDASEE